LLWAIYGPFIGTGTGNAVGILAVAFDGDCKEFRLIGTLTVGPTVVNILSKKTWKNTDDACRAATTGNHHESEELGYGQYWDLVFADTIPDVVTQSIIDHDLAMQYLEKLRGLQEEKASLHYLNEYMEHEISEDAEDIASGVFKGADKQ
jgi:hypothetical protein